MQHDILKKTNQFTFNMLINYYALILNSSVKLYKPFLAAYQYLYILFIRQLFFLSSKCKTHRLLWTQTNSC